ncbi:MAG: YtxH domain-containing protein [Candidatus Eremiobacteraeota bacterium]|nr:YtxH domain-containing protein [Candidatus Eremiobacteraeota bacterium]
MAGWLTGALVGACLAMLLTPTAAPDVRELLRAKADEGAREKKPIEAITP